MRLRFVIFITIFLIGVAPLLSLVAINLKGHIERHEEVEQKRLLANSRLIQGKLLNSIKYLGVDPTDFIPEYQNSWWINENGSYLHLPDQHTSAAPPKSKSEPSSNNAFSDFPGLSEKIKTNEPFIWKTSKPPSVISWIPVAKGAKNETVLWIGQTIDTSGARAWKRALINNIAAIVFVTMVVLFFIAKLIAAKVDDIQKDMLSGLKKTLNHEEHVHFKWQGPQEVKTLAKDLTALCNQYIVSRQESLDAENQLRESENRFRKLTSSAQDAIIMMNNDGDIAFWNKASESIFGYTTEQAMGKSIHALLELGRPDLPESHGDEQLKNRLSGQPSSKEIIELTARTKNGMNIFIELSLSAARIKDKWHAIWIARDITAKKAAEEEAERHNKQLIQADKMYSLGLLVSGVAHEINNPNSITILNTSMLYNSWKSITPILDEYYEDNGDFVVAGLEYSEMREQIPRLFKELEESGVRVRNIVKDLKDYSRQDPSKSNEEIDLNEAIATAVRLTNNQIKKSTNNFLVDKTPNLPPIKGSIQRIEQVIINLIQNACEAIDENNKQIKISSYYRKSDKEICLVVEDEGKGVSEKEINNLVDPFFTSKRDQGGTGLGLSVSAGIVKQHNGQMKFDSTLGKGTKVTVTFPIANG